MAGPFVDAVDPYAGDQLTAQLNAANADPSRYPTGGNPFLAAVAPTMAGRAQNAAIAAAQKLSAEGAPALPDLIRALAAPGGTIGPGGMVTGAQTPLAYAASQPNFNPYAAYRLASGTTPSEATQAAEALQRARYYGAEAAGTEFEVGRAQNAARRGPFGAATGAPGGPAGPAGPAGPGGPTSSLKGMTNASATQPPTTQPSTAGAGTTAEPATTPPTDEFGAIPQTYDERVRWLARMPADKRARFLRGPGTPKVVSPQAAPTTPAPGGAPGA
jgi:hypothetical protein